MTRAISVLVVEDSLTVRKHIVEILSADAGFEVVGEAADGKTAIELCQKLAPAAVTMDIMLPILSGMAATEYIMAYCPTPILIVSGSANRGERFKTCDALAAGAVDVLDKPDGLEPDKQWADRFLSALRVVSRIRVLRHPRARLGRLGQEATWQPRESDAATRVERRVVAIGASTGGPGAVLKILGALPHDFPFPILLVMHISEPFGAAMVEWLDAQLALRVRYPESGEVLPSVGSGCVLMAPPNKHMTVRGGRVVLTDDAERHSCRPAVDVLFESLAVEVGSLTVACLLTGMGKDGALGLLELRKAGALTLAQDEATSVVFGMPAEAVRLDAAREVLPIDAFASVLLKLPSASSTAGGHP